MGICSVVESASYKEIAFCLMCVGKINPIENIVKYEAQIILKILLNVRINCLIRHWKLLDSH